MKKDCSVIILAAGKANRMGQIKFGLKMTDGKIFLENIIGQFSAFGCSRIVVVVNSAGKSFLERNRYKFPGHVDFILNRHPEYERFYSLKTGLSALSGKGFVFIHNADNPFVEQELLEKIYFDREEADVIKPVFDGKGGHPVLISDKIRNEIMAEADNDVRLDDFLRQYVQKRVKADNDKILVNINTLDDYNKL